MSFFERYEKLCLDKGYKPGSEQAARVLGTNRGTISAWKTSGKPPKTEFLIAIANFYHVSIDYLLCRTDDPTDHANINSIAERQTIRSEAATKGTRLMMGQEATPTGTMLYNQLDSIDRGKVEAFTQGLLAQEKYTTTDGGKKHA